MLDFGFIPVSANQFKTEIQNKNSEIENSKSEIRKKCQK